MKTCINCGVSFSGKRCAICHRAAQARYRANNPELMKARDQKYRLKNKERVLAVNAAWKAANPERRKEIDRAWQSANRDKCNLAFKRWASKNKPARSANTMKRYADKSNATPSWANMFFISEAYNLARLRTQITGIKWHVDHVVPLRSKVVCGLHVEVNLQVIPAIENIKKNNKFEVR